MSGPVSRGNEEEAADGASPAAGAPPPGDVPAVPGRGPGGAKRTGLLPRLRHRQERLGDQREVHRRRSKVVRVAWIVGAVLVIVLGILMSGPGIPGPGILVIAGGLFMLALEFDWAGRLLGRVLDYAEAASRRAGNASPLQRGLVIGAVVLAIVAYIVAAYLWEIPVLPG